VEVPEPVPGPGEVAVRVRAVAVNFPDVLLARGEYQVRPEVPFTPGIELCGDVVAVGPGVERVRVGERVVGSRIGVLAEVAVLAEQEVFPAPPTLDDAEAASLTIAYQTAWFALHRRAGLREGETVLVHAAAGGVGLLAVQIARATGARVIGTASEANHEVLRGFGAEPVEYGEGLADRVRELAPDGVDVVVDFIGGVLDTTLAVLKDGGRHGSIVDGEVAEQGGLYAWVRPSAADLQTLSDLADQGLLTVPVAQVFPLEKAAEAFRVSQGGHVRGKIAIEVSR
jgi:NADPH:quinone reductase-like Zn-dependent oxidoreductase